MSEAKEIKNYVIPVIYTAYGYVTVTAVDDEDAIQTAHDYEGQLPLPTDTDYVEGTFEIVADYYDVERDTEMYERGEIKATCSNVVSNKAKHVLKK